MSRTYLAQFGLVFRSSTQAQAKIHTFRGDAEKHINWAGGWIISSCQC